MSRMLVCDSCPALWIFSAHSGDDRGHSIPVVITGIGRALAGGDVPHSPGPLVAGFAQKGHSVLGQHLERRSSWRLRSFYIPGADSCEPFPVDCKKAC